MPPRIRKLPPILPEPGTISPARFRRNNLEFFRGLKYFHVEDDYLFVHAGIRPGIALADQTPEDMMWIRESFLSHRGRFEKMVVAWPHAGACAGQAFQSHLHRLPCACDGRLTALVLERENQNFLDVRNKTPLHEVMQGLQAVNS